MVKLNYIFTKAQSKFDEIIEKPLLTSSIVLTFIALLVCSLSFKYYYSDLDAFWPQILVEAHGMIFDIAVIGILLVWLNQNGEMRQRIKTYKHEIDDFRLWESDEAAFRIVGNLKRLSRHGIYEIDLVNCYLARTNLNYVNLKGSNMNSVNLSYSSLIESNLENTRLNQANLQEANLNQVNLCSAYASGSNFNSAFLIKAQLEGAFLIKTSFKNAFLMEANLKRSYLMGADFENASLFKADLRGVQGLTTDQLAKAKTLYLAKFDDALFDELKMNIPELVGH